MLSCYRRRRKVGAFLDGELPPAQADTVSRHLAGCGACRSEADRLKQLHALLSAPGLLAEPDWTGLWPAVVRGIEARRAGVAVRRDVPLASRRRLSVGAVSMAAAAVLTLALFWLGPRPPEGPPPASPPSGISHLVELADTEYPDGVMVYSPAERDLTVIWVFSPEATGGAI